MMSAVAGRGADVVEGGWRMEPCEGLRLLMWSGNDFGNETAANEEKPEARTRTPDAKAKVETPEKKSGLLLIRGSGVRIPPGAPL
jgi:hypothetical protein